MTSSDQFFPSFNYKSKFTFICEIQRKQKGQQLINIYISCHDFGIGYRPKRHDTQLQIF